MSITLCYAQADFSATEKLLQEADKNKLSSPEYALQLIEELEQNDEFSNQHRYKITEITAIANAYSGQPAKSIDLISKQINSIAKQLLPENPDLLIDYLYLRSSFYQMSGELMLALSDVTTALHQLSDTHNNAALVQKLYYRAGHLYLSLENTEDAFKYLQKAEELLLTTGNSYRKCLINIELAKAYYVENQYGESLRFIENSKEVCMQADNSLVIVAMSDLEAKNLNKTGASDKAIIIAEDLLSQLTTTNNSYAYQQVMITYAFALLNSGMPDKAIDIANQAANLSEKNTYTEVIRDASLVLALAEEESGNLKEALNYYKKYQEYKEKNTSTKVTQSIAFYTNQIDIKDKELQINNLEQLNKIMMLDKKLATQKFQFTILMTICLILALLILSVMVYRLWRAKIVLKQLSHLDPLTRIANRLCAIEWAEHYLSKHKDGAHQLSIIMFDLDNFKSINDTYGHITGDNILKAVAEKISDVLRPNQKLSRFGGEEFLIFLPETPLPRAVQIAEQCRTMLHSIDVKALGLIYPVTASFGVHTIDRDTPLDIGIQQTDIALYKAKQNGRDTVAVYDFQMYQEQQSFA
ncbi:diguanylate cyclase [Chromatiaceae bacterium AAb-1]|nr:diguanylate cyclase [Chromatiaceae bacterium AAb-1]